jgi:hypothetical protein
VSRAEQLTSSAVLSCYRRPGGPARLLVPCSVAYSFI